MPDLRNLIEYNPETGLFRWRVRINPRCAKGWFAGSMGSRGYPRVRVNGVLYNAHRLAWILHTGAPAEIEIDHINGKPSDNRWCNLRLATRQQNAINRGPQSNNSTGLKGVSVYQRLPPQSRYEASIKIGPKRIRLGFFPTPEQAHAAYCRAAAEHHKEFARTK